MSTIPAPARISEEWNDADFDLPEGSAFHAVVSDKDDEDEDWDMDMDLGKTGGAKARAVVAGLAARSVEGTSQLGAITIRPPLVNSDSTEDDEDDEGVSTIKVATVRKFLPARPVPEVVAEDFEDGFALPEDLTQLSLAPLSLNHRVSKASLEWGDKDHTTSSSQSSDAYSSLGLADTSPSSNSTSSLSSPTPETDDDDCDDEGDLDGLVLPSALFGTGDGGRRLAQMLEAKKKLPVDNLVALASPDPEDDFEMGLIIDDDMELSPSRLLSNTQHHQSRFNRSQSMPIAARQLKRPSSRIKSVDQVFPPNPPISSVRQLSKLTIAPSPTRSGFLSPKPGSLRGQKSHSGLQIPSPPSTSRRLSRKASLSSLMEVSNSQIPPLSATPLPGPSKARYEEPTAASRAKSYKNSTSRVQEFKVPPTRPCTPSSNPAALRLTMPTQGSKIKLRPALSGIFGGNGSNPISRAKSPVSRTISPAIPRPPSSLSRSIKPQLASPPRPPVAPRQLKRPKRQRLYGDGTELDGFDDLPTDRDKESRYRVQPKSFSSRVPGGNYASKAGTIRKKSRSSLEPQPSPAPVPSLKRTSRLDLSSSSNASSSKASEPAPKKKKNVLSSSITRKKPTLIRNLGGVGHSKVVGDMKWNPQTLRWEGNDQVLREFDAAVGTSTRPALITHLTGSSIGMPVGGFAAGARIVGNMIFDPSKMCWMSTLPPEDDEPDVFADLADDEEDGDRWQSRSGTLRGTMKSPSSNASMASVESAGSAGPTRASGAGACPPSPTHSQASSSHRRSLSGSDSERGSRASLVYNVDASFAEQCQEAEARHRHEMRGWQAYLSSDLAKDRTYLYDIRALATRQY
ncbi:hypothetical protein FISHEDRAFT_60885 [Fistulina hepatica ATCC 64428]|uniref:Protein byr4 n=1 Tax=Fistulina hepatica ATCC 64428 TaxID=1128425 RepID=A0A0D7A4S4_9AGAR|nr:hypothetical protein FISHEDRAFT_60885 [Fistulina hepatica ATCC 64428]